MNRSSISPQAKSKGKQLNKVPSAGLIEFLTTKYNNKVPVAAITAATKYFGKHRPLKKDDRVLKRLSSNSSEITTSALTDFLSTQTHEKGKPLSQEGILRVFEGFANDGKLSFQYILKLGQSNGVVISQKVAKLIVRKYGKRKDHLSAQDCKDTVGRRQSGRKSTSKSPKK